MRGVSCIDNLYSLAIPSLEKPCTAVQVSEASELSLSLDLTLKEHGEVVQVWLSIGCGFRSSRSFVCDSL